MAVLQALPLLAALMGALPLASAIQPEQVIYALNAGSPEIYLDSNGIMYRPDHLMLGKASIDGIDAGFIRRVPEQDYILYQTERFHVNDFTYTVHESMPDGEYAAVLKFAESYFEGEGRKVFDVHFNGIPVVNKLDIVVKAGDIFTAHDEIVPFKVSENGKKLTVNGKSTPFKGKLYIEFKKLEGKDNPKICAFYVAKGTLQELQIPPLLPLTYEDVPYVREEWMEGAGEGGAEMPGDEEPYPPPPTPNTRPEVVDTTEGALSRSTLWKAVSAITAFMTFSGLAYFSKTPTKKEKL